MHFVCAEVTVLVALLPVFQFPLLEGCLLFLSEEAYTEIGFEGNLKIEEVSIL